MPEQSLFSAYWPYYLPTYLILTAVAYLLARAILGMFVRPESPNIVWRVLVVTTEPIMRIARRLTPGFMVEGLLPVVAAGWLLLIWYFFRELMMAQGLAPPLG